MNASMRLSRHFQGVYPAAVLAVALTAWASGVQGNETTPPPELDALSLTCTAEPAWQDPLRLDRLDGRPAACPDAEPVDPGFARVATRQ